MAQNVQVCCRFRPFNQTELKESTETAVEFIDDGKSVKSTGKTYVFDHVFNPQSTQIEVFEKTAKPMVESLLRGYNTTIFAYGQTGSGKTHTMMGQAGTPQQGIIPRTVEELFRGIEAADADMEFTLKLSYIEIYMEKVRDLLNTDNDNLRIREIHGDVWIEDVTELYVGSLEEVLEIMRQGETNRSIASTRMNEESSRSHSVFILTLGQEKSGSKKSSKLILVDLAGSEKVRKTGAVGATLKEAQHINKSLSALGNVINALTENHKHVPYRDSKLTRLLSSSLGGNSQTCLIVTASPSMFNSEETISTLRFGTRAKRIKNKPRINLELTVQQYKELLDAADKKIKSQAKLIKELERELSIRNGERPSSPTSSISSQPSTPTFSKRSEDEEDESDAESDTSLSHDEDTKHTKKRGSISSTGTKGTGQSLVLKLQDKVLELEKNKGDLQEELDKMKDQLEDSDRKITALGDQSKKVDELKQDLLKAESKVAQLQDELTEAKAFHKKFALMEKEYQMKIEQLRRTNSTHSSQSESFGLPPKPSESDKLIKELVIDSNLPPTTTFDLPTPHIDRFSTPASVSPVTASPLSATPLEFPSMDDSGTTSPTSTPASLLASQPPPLIEPKQPRPKKPSHRKSLTISTPSFSTASSSLSSISPTMIPGSTASTSTSLVKTPATSGIPSFVTTPLSLLSPAVSSKTKDKKLSKKHSVIVPTKSGPTPTHVRRNSTPITSKDKFDLQAEQEAAEVRRLEETVKEPSPTSLRPGKPQSQKTTPSPPLQPINTVAPFMSQREKELTETNKRLLRDLQSKCEQHLRLSLAYADLQQVDYDSRQHEAWNQERAEMLKQIHGFHQIINYQKNLLKNRTEHIDHLEHALHESNASHRQVLMQHEKAMESLNEKAKKQEEMVQMLLKDRDSDSKRHFATSPRIIVRGGAVGGTSGGGSHHGSFSSPRKGSSEVTRPVSTSVTSGSTSTSTTLSSHATTFTAPGTNSSLSATSTSSSLLTSGGTISDGSEHVSGYESSTSVSGSSKYAYELKRRDSEPLEPQPDPDIDVDSNFFAAQGVILPKEPSSSPPRRSSLLQRLFSGGTTPILQKLKRGSQTNIPIPPAYQQQSGSSSTTGTPLVLKSASSSHIPSLSPTRPDLPISMSTSALLGNMPITASSAPSPRRQSQTQQAPTQAQPTQPTPPKGSLDFILRRKEAAR